MPSTATSLNECVFCGAQMLDTATECSACGKVRTRSMPVSEWNAFTPKTHFAALWILSFGLYIVPWFYRAWRFLRLEMREDVSPLWRTVLMFVPIVGQVLMFQLVKDIVWVTARSEGSAFGTVMFVWGSFVVGGGVDKINQDWAILFYLIPGIGLWPVQRRINDYYSASGAITHASMPIYGWIICVFAGLAWALFGLVLLGVLPAE